MSRRKSWQEDLIPVAVAILGQFALLQFVDWARANVATQEIARQWVEHRFYFAPQAASLLIVLLILRAIRSFLREQGVEIGDFLRSYVVVLLLSLLLDLRRDEGLHVVHEPGFGEGVRDERRAAARARRGDVVIVALVVVLVVLVILVSVVVLFLVQRRRRQRGRRRG